MRMNQVQRPARKEVHDFERRAKPSGWADIHKSSVDPPAANEEEDTADGCFYYM